MTTTQDSIAHRKGGRVSFTYRGERVTGKIVAVRKDGMLTVDVEDHSDEDVGWVDVRSEAVDQ